MKTFRRAILATPLMLFLTMSPVRANLYLTSNPTFGSNSITVDTSSGLGWLNLSEADGLSYQQVSAEMGPGGTFSGFRYATVQEVLGLYNSAGLTVGFYPGLTPAIQSLFSLIGTTGTLNGESGIEPQIVALSGTSLDGGYCAPAIYGFVSSPSYWVNNGGFTPNGGSPPGGGGTIYGSTFSYPSISSWLVEEVPEPASALLFILVSASWYGFRFLRRRNGAG